MLVASLILAWSSIFPPKASIPAGCLYHLRVWLRVKGIDHRLFGDDELWVGQDPDFDSLREASFARLKEVSHNNTQIYQGYVGRVLVTFIIRFIVCHVHFVDINRPHRWQRLQTDLYKYSLEYEAGGVGCILFEDFRLKIECDPRRVTFLI